MRAREGTRPEGEEWDSAVLKLQAIMKSERSPHPKAPKQKGSEYGKSMGWVERQIVVLVPCYILVSPPIFLPDASLSDVPPA